MVFSVHLWQIPRRKIDRLVYRGRLLQLIGVTAHPNDFLILQTNFFQRLKGKRDHCSKPAEVALLVQPYNGAYAMTTAKDC